MGDGGILTRIVVAFPSHRMLPVVMTAHSGENSTRNDGGRFGAEHVGPERDAGKRPPALRFGPTSFRSDEYHRAVQDDLGATTLRDTCAVLARQNREALHVFDLGKPRSPALHGRLPRHPAQALDML